MREKSLPSWVYILTGETDHKLVNKFVNIASANDERCYGGQQCRGIWWEGTFLGGGFNGSDSPE